MQKHFETLILYTTITEVHYDLNNKKHLMFLLSLSVSNIGEFATILPLFLNIVNDEAVIKIIVMTIPLHSSFEFFFYSFLATYPPFLHIIYRLHIYLFDHLFHTKYDYYPKTLEKKVIVTI